MPIANVSLRSSRQEECVQLADQNLTVINRHLNLVQSEASGQVHPPQFQSEKPPLLIYPQSTVIFRIEGISLAVAENKKRVLVLFQVEFVDRRGNVVKHRCLLNRNSVTIGCSNRLTRSLPSSPDDLKRIPFTAEEDLAPADSPPSQEGRHRLLHLFRTSLPLSMFWPATSRRGRLLTDEVGKVAKKRAREFADCRQFIQMGIAC